MDVVQVDRAECDACGYDAHTEAFVFASHPDWPAGLAYCGSHGTQYLAELHACGATVIDLRHRLHE